MQQYLSVYCILKLSFAFTPIVFAVFASMKNCILAEYLYYNSNSALAGRATESTNTAVRML